MPEAFSRPAPAALLVPCAFGVALRLFFLLLAGELELQSDEANYVYSALAWNRFGFYSDQYRYLWPPGYVWLVAQALDAFGARGLLALKLAQVLASAAVGLSTGLLAWRLAGRAAARLSTWIWALYLPLVAFTHYLWNETLFLALFVPATYQLLAAMQEGEEARERRFVLAGLLLGAALYLKEMPLWLVPILALLVALRGGTGAGEGLRRGALLLLTVAAVVLPWTLRNHEVYGRVLPVGASLGENVYNGLNAPYKNFDVTPFVRQGEAVPVRSWLIAADPRDAWERAEEHLNLADRQSANLRRGLDYAARHPGWLLRSRVQKLADLVAPVSFLLRHLGLGHYGASPLGGGGARRMLALWALLCPALVLPLGIAGWFGLRDRAGRALFLAVLGYVLATGLLVAMSRFRVPALPYLITLAAVLLRPAGGSAWTRGRLLGAGMALLALAGLWWVAWPQTASILASAWGVAP